MEQDVVLVESTGPIAWIRLNRPVAFNSLNLVLLDQLNRAISSVEESPNIRAVVVTGAGKAFCAGADLKEIGGTNGSGSVDTDLLLKFVQYTATTVGRLASLPKPVIAAVNGLALAGGLELMLACDLVIAAQSAKIGDAHSNYGLLPGAGGAVRLARLVGPRVAKYLTFTGEFVPASDLVSVGLVNEVVPDEDLVPRADKLARTVARKSADGLRHMKRLIDQAHDVPMNEGVDLEMEALKEHARSTDLREGLASFREKRKPRFTQYEERPAG